MQGQFAHKGSRHVEFNLNVKDKPSNPKFNLGDHYISRHDNEQLFNLQEHKLGYKPLTQITNNVARAELWKGDV